MSIEVGDRDLRTPAECYVERARVEPQNLRANLWVLSSKDKTRRKIKKCGKLNVQPILIVQTFKEVYRIPEKSYSFRRIEFLLATVGNIAYHGRGPARLHTSPIYFNVSSTYGEL